MLYDNYGLDFICKTTLKIEKSKFNDLNHLVAMSMAGITAGSRFPGPLNSDLGKIGINLIPFPRLHYFMTGFSPLT